MKSKDTTTKDTTVKIDSALLGDVEEYINKEENRLKYVNKKQFIDIAVYEFLKKEKRNGR